MNPNRASRPESKGRHALRIVGWTFLALFIVLINVVAGGLLYLKTDRAREQALAFGLKKLGPVIPGGVTIGSSEGDLTSGLVLHELVLRDLDGRPAVEAHRVELAYSLLPLIVTRVQVNVVAVDGLTVISQPLADGRDNLATMAVVNQPLPKPPQVIPVSVALSLIDVQARFVKLPAHGTIEHAPRDTDVNARLHVRAGLSHGMVASIDELTVDVVSPARAKITAHGGVHIADKVDLRKMEVRVEGDTTALRRRVEKLELSGPVTIVASADGPIDDLDASLDIDTHEPKMHLSANAHMLRDRAELKRFEIASAFANVTASGVYRYDQTGEGGLKVEVSDLQPFTLFGAPEMSGSVKLDAHAKRDGKHLVARADGTVNKLKIGADRIGHIGIDVDIEDWRGHALVEASDLMLGTFALRTAKLKAEGSEKSMHVAAEAHGADGLDMEVAAGAIPTVVDKRLSAVAVTLERLRLRAGGAPWREDGPATFTANLDVKKFVLGPLGLSNDKQHITVEGKMLDQVLADVHLDVKHFDLSQLPALLSPGHVLPHTDVDATAEAKGPLAGLDAGARFKGTGDGRTNHDLIHITTNGEARLEKGRLNAKFFATIGGQKVSATGDLPMPLRPDQPIEAKFDASVMLNPMFANILVPKLIQSQPVILYTLGAKVTAQAVLSGTTSDPHLNASARVARWGAANSHGDLAVSVEYKQKHLAGSGTLTFSRLPAGGGKGAGVVEATAEMPVDLAPALSGTADHLFDRAGAWHANLNLKHVEIERLPFEAFDVVPLVRHGWVDATAQLGGSEEDPRATLHFDASELDFAGLSGVGMIGDAKLEGSATTADLKMTVRGSEPIRVKGSIGEHPRTVSWRHAPLAATFDAPSFDLGRVQLFQELAGTLHASGKVTGSWSHPHLVAEANADGVRSGTVTYKKLGLTATVKDDRFSGELVANDGAGASLTVEAAAPLSGGAMSGSIAATGFKTDLRSELLPVLRSLKGQLDGNVKIGGTTSKPQLLGKLRLANAEVALATTAITYRDGHANVGFDANGVALEGMHFTAGTGGALDGDAHFTVRDLHVDALTAKLDLRHYPMAWDTTTGLADASVSVGGKREAKSGGFTTTVNVVRGRVELEDDREVKGLIPLGHLEDVKVAKARPEPISVPLNGKPKAAPTPGPTYVVFVKGPIAVHSRELELAATANLRVDLSGSSPIASGGLNFAPHGTVKLFGQKYELERGQVSFLDSVQPKIDFRVGRKVSKARIGIDLGGTERQPTTVFWSEPASYERPQEVAAQVTGQSLDKDGVVKKGIEMKVSGPLSNLIAVWFKQSAPASKTVDVQSGTPPLDATKNKP